MKLSYLIFPAYLHVFGFCYFRLTRLAGVYRETLLQPYWNFLTLNRIQASWTIIWMYLWIYRR